MKKYLITVIAAFTLAGCSGSNKSVETESIESEDCIETEYSKENLLKYQEKYKNEWDAEFTDEQLEEMKAWVEDNTAYFVAETDKMIDAVHEYTMEKWGTKYTPCSWPEDYRPDKLPEVINWGESIMSMDGVSYILMLCILNENKKLNIYDDRYKSKANYYMSRVWALAMSGEPDFSEFLNNGLISLHSGEFSIEDVKKMDDTEREMYNM